MLILFFTGYALKLSQAKKLKTTMFKNETSIRATVVSYFIANSLLNKISGSFDYEVFVEVRLIDNLSKAGSNRQVACVFRQRF